MEKTEQFTRDKVEQLTRLFMRVDAGESPEKVRREAELFLSTVGPREAAMAEQLLIQSGTNIEQLRRRCLAHISLLGDQVTKLRLSLPVNHIIRIILAEHEMMLCFLADLEELNKEIQQMSYCSPTSTEIRKLVHIVSHLVAAGDHEFREAEFIFPELERHGYYGPPEILKTEHSGLDTCKREIAELAKAASEKTDFGQFKRRLDAAVRYMVPAMRQEIFTEDNILYPVAIEVISNKTVWDKIKASCEQIGYCGFDARL
jgi:DUF438 domain-containing protein